jgi:hypothetical protein
VGTAVLLRAAGALSATILAALGVGIAIALARPGRIWVGARPASAAQAVVGVVLGANLTPDAISVLAEQWMPFLASTLAMLVLSIALGVAVNRLSGLDPPTATLAVVPGGALGIVAMAKDLGGDVRLVAFSQYLRVLVILTGTPVLAASVLTHPAGPAQAAQHATTPGLAGMATGLAIAGVGWYAARRAGVAAGSLLGPLALAAVWAIFVGAHIGVPAAVRDAAFALIGLDVGLRFTRDALREARRLAPVIAAALAALLIGCFGLACFVTATTTMPLRDAYLATTPGGLTVVAATAFGIGADTGLVVASQSVRLVVMLLCAPTAVRLTVRTLSGRVPEAVSGAPTRGEARGG